MAGTVSTWRTWPSLLPFVLSLLLSLSSVASAQTLTLTLTPTDSTDDPRYTAGGNGDGILLGIWHDTSASPRAVFPVTALTDAAAQNIAPTPLDGSVVLATVSNQQTISARSIALISCDPSTSYLGPVDVFNTAAERNATAIILYSAASQTCLASGLGDYQNVYAMSSRDNSNDMVMEVDTHPAWARLAVRDTVTNGTATGSGGSGSSSNNNTPQNPLGPSPSTAVAMVILYSITGVITALFLCIIVTGAIRAHRHPERYGPRNLIGRPRQTRARGLARAMLDSLPIVKVGDRTGQAAKPSEVELENGQQQHGPAASSEEQTTARGPNDPPATSGDGVVHPATGQPSEASSNDSDIAPVTATTTDRNHSTPAEEESEQGCSICTEDFAVGEDQRVLPCDHRFHPACIDPWLLNVSGTCPLCRIDLRPADVSEEEEVDEQGNPVARGGLAPPLENGEGSRAARVRRSLMIGIMGVARPERLSREERVAALRRYRDSAAARSEGQRQTTVGTNNGDAEDESSRRRRFRDRFRVRTRRTGESGTVRDEPAADVAATDEPRTS